MVSDAGVAAVFVVVQQDSAPDPDNVCTSVHGYATHIPTPARRLKKAALKTSSEQGGTIVGCPERYGFMARGLLTDSRHPPSARLCA